MIRRNLFILIILLIVTILSEDKSNSLKIVSNYEVGQIEVGGPFVGIEIHKSFPMINRISFYYPVANSIDISEDYWKRENYRIMSMGLKIGNEPKFILEKEAWKVLQTPYDVEFQKNISNSGIKIKYEFLKSKPVMAADFIITNNSDSSRVYEVYLRFETILRTSHTYDLFDNGRSNISDDKKLLTVEYDFLQTGHSKIFFYNVGEEPKYTISTFCSESYASPGEYWLHSNEYSQESNINGKPIAFFIYKKELQPGESMNITQLIGSTKLDEADDVINYVSHNYRKEIADYGNYILSNSIDKEVIKTGNNNFDFTTDWALAVMKTNAHYLDGEILPMPAQAEYNFYFTHDALLTDLAAVYFDTERVKNDLEFIIKHADENNVIPHAYYWKDTDYMTEYAGTENWNHFWFTLLSTRYLRHSKDLEFANRLYPYVLKSIETALKNKEDNLMCSRQPDWWDIGNNHGPRAYMTILAVRALREFGYLQAELNMDISKIQHFQNIADTLHNNLIERLWNDELNYLTNYFNDGSEDKHIYMGSMLASHFELLDREKNYKLMETAKKYLLDEKLGVYTLYPMDLHLLTEYMGFVENEAGQPYYYANGGIWPHGNAWYVLGLISNKKFDEAYNFIKNIMTMEGVINSPNGQPAMYEYRISDKSNPEVYGKIDKPQFLWAAGWYIYSLYNLFGVKENIWNISIEPLLPNEIDSVKLTVNIGGDSVPVTIKGKGLYASSILYDGVFVPSYIIPEVNENISEIIIELGELKHPIITKAGAKISNLNYSELENKLSFTAKSFHENSVVINLVSPIQPREIKNNQSTIEKVETNYLKDGNYSIKFEFTQEEENKIDIYFN